MCTSPDGDRLGRAGGLAEASAATTGVSRARVALEDRARHTDAACGGLPLARLVVCV